MVAEFDTVLAGRAGRRPSCSSTRPRGMFAAGADIRECATWLRPRTPRDQRGAVRAARGARWPTIALVDGPALGGGCEMALACDFRIASPRAVFAQPELSLGILAGAGGNWRLHNSSAWPPRGACCTPAPARRYRGACAGLVDEIADDLRPAARPSPRPSRNGPGVPWSSQSWRCAHTVRTPSISTRRRKRCCSTAQTSTSG